MSGSRAGGTLTNFTGEQDLITISLRSSIVSTSSTSCPSHFLTLLLYYNAVFALVPDSGGVQPPLPLASSASEEAEEPQNEAKSMLPLFEFTKDADLYSPAPDLSSFNMVGTGIASQFLSGRSGNDPEEYLDWVQVHGLFVKCILVQC